MPYFELDACDEKNREGSSLPIRADLAADLERWLDDKLGERQAEARLNGEPVPGRLPGDTKLFTVPAGLVRILDRDLRAAGIPKFDDRGRSIDVHTLRHTFGTLLSKGGVPLRTAQAAMRHSDPSLTANVYTDPKLLDIGGALDALPALPLDSDPSNAQEQAQALKTGTCDSLPLAPTLALTNEQAGQNGGSPDNTNPFGLLRIHEAALAVNAYSVNEKRTLTSSVSVLQKSGDRTRLELFVAGLNAWDAVLRRRIDDGTALV